MVNVWEVHELLGASEEMLLTSIYTKDKHTH